ncbi:MAG: tRNA lysidine(34) synthetase TilS, partial [Solobacterium sp.]|nr:tRNA lysidine(34) synthetase TilS [Solobacterium sp.]
SGGPDSMALLDMCLKAGVRTAAAHVNYHYRDQADEEEAYVRAFCKARGIVCHVLNEPFTWEGNFEAAARKHRYDFFASLVRQYGYAGVLTGHQEDDLIETYLMQEEKGIIPEYYGLREALMYSGVQIRRPLLDHTKKELQEYCEENGIRYWLDSTNDSDAYTRNRIRHETVEPMDEFMRKMVRREIEEKNAVLHEQRCRVYALIDEEAVQLSAYRALPEDDRLTLLRKLLEKDMKSVSRPHLCQIDRIIMKQKDILIDLKHGQLINDSGKLKTREKPVPYTFVCRDLQELRQLSWKAFRIQDPAPGVFAVTLQEDDWPVTLRTWQAGDAAEMRYGTKSVHRFFIDRHIPRWRRQDWPVLENASGKIILIPGLGCDVHHWSETPTINIEVQL